MTRLRIHPALTTILVLAAATPGPALAQLPALNVGVHIQTEIGPAPTGSVVADFDRDGHLDYAVALQGVDSVTVLLGDGRGGTRSKRNYATAPTPTGMAAADFSGDGLVDLALTDLVGNTVSILLGKPNGEFGVHVDYPTSDSPFTVAVADFDNDSKLDLVVAGNSNYFSIHRGTGTGAFEPKTDVPGLGNTAGAAAGDVDNDGKMDVVTLSSGGSRVLLYRGDGAGGFAPRLEYAVGLGPTHLALGDLNADGILDVVTGNYDGRSVSYLYGTGTGFGTPAVTLPQLPLQVSHVAIGDLNGDGRPDLVANQSSSTGFKLYRATPGGGFFPEETLATTYVPQSFSVIDVDHDGWNDLVTAMNFFARLSVHRSFGIGPLAPGTDYAASSPSRARFVDLTGDGLLDLVNTTYSANAISFRPGDGEGGFGARVDRAAPAPKPTTFSHADVDGDGRQDLAVLCDQGVAFMDTLFILKVTGEGTFTKTAFGTGSVPGSIAFGRANADTLPDITIANTNDNTVSVLMNDGTGGYGTRVDYPSGTFPRDAVFADVDGDGDQDLAYVNYVGSQMWVRKNDGLGAFGGPVIYQTAGGPHSIEAGDFNGDGRIDLVAGCTSAVSMLLNIGNNGQFGGKTDFPVIPSSTDMTIGDVDNDGRLDVAVNNAKGFFSLFLGDGNGRLGPRHDLPQFSTPNTVALGDVDGDARLDAVTANYEGNSLTVRLSRAATVTTLVASPNPCALGQQLTLTATVAVPDGSQSPAGEVRFYDGFAALGTAPLVGGVATFAFTTGDAWFRTFSAEFLGADRLRPSRSRPIDLMVYVPSVDVPPGLPGTPPSSLDLAGARPNPSARGHLRVHFSLPTAAPATLELFDVSGRRIARQDVSGLGPGFHAVALEGGRPVPPGVYHLRLTQGTEVRVARAVVTD